MEILTLQHVTWEDDSITKTYDWKKKAWPLRVPHSPPPRAPSGSAQPVWGQPANRPNASLLVGFPFFTSRSYRWCWHFGLNQDIVMQISTLDWLNSIQNATQYFNNGIQNLSRKKKSRAVLTGSKSTCEFNFKNENLCLTKLKIITTHANAFYGKI